MGHDGFEAVHESVGFGAGNEFDVGHRQLARQPEMNASSEWFGRVQSANTGVQIEHIGGQLEHTGGQLEHKLFLTEVEGQWVLAGLDYGNYRHLGDLHLSERIIGINKHYFNQSPFLPLPPDDKRSSDGSQLLVGHLVLYAGHVAAAAALAQRPKWVERVPWAPPAASLVTSTGSR